MDSRRQPRWGRAYNSVRYTDFTREEIEEIIRGGDLETLRYLSEYYYRTNGIYRNNINFLASLPLYDTIVIPVFEQGKGSKAQIIKAFYNACYFIEALDLKNTLARITREWLKSGIYNGLLVENANHVTIIDLPIAYCRTRYKDFNNLNVLEFNLQYFISRYEDEKEREAAVLTFPKIIQTAWRAYKNKQLTESWVQVSASDGGVCFCFAEDQSPLLIASIPELYQQKDAVGREEKRDENELYKLLIQRMPLDPQSGELAFKLEEVAEMHAGVASMLQDVDTVDVLTTFGDTSLESLQDSNASTQSASRIEKYNKNAYSSLGRGELIFNPTNSSSLSYAIKKDESLMKFYLNAYSTWIKFLLNQRFTRNGLKFDFEILPTTLFNIKDYQSLYFTGAQFGYSKMYAGVASGIKQIDQISLMDFENDFLKMTEKMIPLQSSYTSSGNSDEKNNSTEKKSSGSNTVKDINNKGGRPELSDEDKSEKTQANIAAMG